MKCVDATPKAHRLLGNRQFYEGREPHVNTWREHAMVTSQLAMQCYAVMARCLRRAAFFPVKSVG